MTIKYFNVKQGITTGNITIDAASGNLTGVGNANLGNLAVANFFSGNGSLLTSITGANVTGTVANATYATSAGSANTAGTVTTNAQPNITSVGTLTELIVGNATANVTITVGGANGTLTATGNITAPYFIGNVQGNISGNIVVPGNNTAVLFNDGGNAGASDAFTFNKDTNVATVSGNLVVQNANLGNLATANFFTGTLTTNAQPNITSVGSLTSLTVTGNASAGNLSTGGDLTVSGNATVTGNLVVDGNLVYVNVDTLRVEDPIIELGGGPNGNALTSNDGKDRGSLLHYYTSAPVDAFMGWDNSNAEFAFGSNVSVTNEVVTFTELGNVRAGFFIGNGSQLTGVAASTAATVTSNAQPNITSVGTLTSLDVSGNLTAGNIIGVFANGNSNISIPAANGNVTVSAEGNANVVVVTGTGVNVAGTLNATGNANVGNLGATDVIATNITGSGTINFTSASNVSLGSVSNVKITGGTNGYLLSTDGLGDLSWIAPPSTSTISNGNSNVDIATAGGNVTTSVNGTSNVQIVTETGVNVSGTLNATGNLTVANANLGNLATANFFAGDGGLLSNITGANVVGQVGNALVAGTVYTNAQPNITSVGTLTSLAVSGNLTSNVIVANTVAVNVGFTSNRANVSVTTDTVIDQFVPSDFRTAKYVISASGDYGYQSVETLLVHDGTNAYITIYGSISSNASSDIIDISSNISGVSGNVSLFATASGPNTIVNIVSSYIKT